MAYAHIEINGPATESELDTEITQATEQMRNQDFDEGAKILRVTLQKIGDSWKGVEPLPSFQTSDQRTLPAFPTRLLANVLHRHPELVPFVLDHYGMHGDQFDLSQPMLVSQSRDLVEGVLSERMQRLFDDLGYADVTKDLRPDEKGIALAHAFMGLQNALLTSMFLYSKDKITFHREETGTMVKSLLDKE